MRYPVELTHDDNGTILVTCPDIPEMTSVGDDEADALCEAVEGLESAIDIYFDERRPVPEPSLARQDQKTVRLPALAVAKVLLHNEMLAQGIKKAELARRLDMAPSNVERIFNIRHKTRIETVEAALRSLGKTIDMCLTA